jgi:glycine betaine/proline transport system substrate-binding protein
VPGYVPAELVSTLADLTRPDVVERMATLVVRGTTSGAGLTTRSQNVVREYGLDTAGWSYRIGDLAAIIATIDGRIAAGEWFVTPLWQPQYLNEVHDLRPLTDPRAVFPPPDRSWIVAHRRAFARLPDRTRTVLSKIGFTVADVNGMDRAVNLNGLDPLTAARGWMERNTTAVQRHDRHVDAQRRGPVAAGRPAGGRDAGRAGADRRDGAGARAGAARRSAG